MKISPTSIPPIPGGLTGDDLIFSVNDKIRRIQLLVSGINQTAAANLTTATTLIQNVTTGALDGLEDSVIYQAAMFVTDAVTLDDPSHYSDLSGYGNSAAMNGVLTQRPYGFDLATNAYVEVTNAKLNPSPLSSGAELSVNGFFVPSGSAFPNWTTVTGSPAVVTNYINDVPDLAPYTGHSVSLTGTSPAATIEQQIAVQKGMIHAFGFWAGGTGSGTGVRYQVVDISSPAHVWSSASAYVVNDLTSYAGLTYVSILNGTNQQPDISPTYWSIYEVVIIPWLSSGINAAVFTHTAIQFVVPETCTAVKIRLSSPADGSTAYATRLSFRQVVPTSWGLVFKKNAPVATARQYMLTQLFDPEDNAASNTMPARLWSMLFPQSLATVSFFFNDDGTGNFNHGIGSVSSFVADTWHYFGVTMYAVPDKYTGYPFYRTQAEMYIDGSFEANFPDATPGVPIYPDFGNAPLRIGATDATANFHYFQGSVGFVHINRKQFSAADFAAASGWLSALMTSRGVVPWTGPAFTPSTRSVTAGVGVTVANQQVNIGQNVGPTATPKLGGLTLTGPGLTQYGGTGDTLHSWRWARADGAVGAFLGINGTTGHPMFGTESSTEFDLVVNAGAAGAGTVCSSWTLDANSLGRQYISTGDGSHLVHHLTWGRTSGSVAGFVGQDSSLDNAILIGSESNHNVVMVANAGATGRGTTCQSWSSDGSSIMGGSLKMASFVFASLPTAANGMVIYCSDAKNSLDDGVAIGSVAASGGAGAMLARVNSSWRTFS